MSRKKRPSGDGVARESWGKLYPLLDLHGSTGADTRPRAERWLRDQQAQGARTVILVTGRGLHSTGIPVVKHEVQHLLADLKGTLVAGWEPGHYGGSFRVELRRPAPDRDAPRPEPEPRLLREVHPALLLQAQEALWELGIAPTPALLEAEIRRLLNEGAEEG